MTACSSRRSHRGLVVSGVLAGSLLVFGALRPVAAAQESSARLTVAGTGLGSLNLSRKTNVGPGTGRFDQAVVTDFSDSFLLLRLDRQLYTTHRAGMVMGFLFPDAETNLGDVFYNQINVFYDTRTFRGTLGRTRLQNFAVEFPTLREEDLLEYSFLLNGSSNAESSEFSRYGNVARAEVFGMDGRLHMRAQATSWTVTDSTGVRQNDFHVNAGSTFFGYRLPEAVRYSGVVRAAGVGLHTQKIETPGNDWLNALSAGLALNLSRHPLRNVEFRSQVIYSAGVDDSTRLILGARTLGTPLGRALAESTSLTASLRFLRRPYQLDRFQAAVTVAYKAFNGTDASQITLVPNMFFQLGQGVDVGVQYQYQKLSSDLATQLGWRWSHSVKFVFAFSFQSMFNDYFGDRDDILSLEHGYIP